MTRLALVGGTAAAVLLLLVVAAVAAVGGFGRGELALMLGVLAAWVVAGWFTGTLLKAHAEGRGLDGGIWRVVWLVAWIVVPLAGPVLVLVVYALAVSNARTRNADAA